MQARRTVAVASPPGGTGKTTISVSLALIYAEAGERVLLADMDQNNNATDWTLRNSEPETIQERNLFHALRGIAGLSDVIHPSPLGFDVLPATPELFYLQRELRRRVKTISDLEALEANTREAFLAELALMPYDRIIIDGPPGLTFESALALAAADVCLMPIRMTRKQIFAHSMLADFAQEVRPAPLPIISVPNAVVSDQEEAALRRAAVGQVDELSRATIRKSQPLVDAMEGGTTVSRKAVEVRKRLSALASEITGAA